MLLDCADAVLDAMDEPDEAMKARGNRTVNFNITVWPCAGSEDQQCDATAEFDSADEVWTAMIDAARSGA